VPERSASEIDLGSAPQIREAFSLLDGLLGRIELHFDPQASVRYFLDNLSAEDAVHLIRLGVASRSSTPAS
jgi:hypothetical protein